jgi:hypothetical protein
METGPNKFPYTLVAFIRSDSNAGPLQCQFYERDDRRAVKNAPLHFWSQTLKQPLDSPEVQDKARTMRIHAVYDGWPEDISLRNWRGDPNIFADEVRKEIENPDEEI